MRRPWPEEIQLAWVAREHSVVQWMHRATALRWVAPLLVVVSRLSDGWIWFAAGLAGIWLGGPGGTACAVRMLALTPVNLLIYLIVKHWIARPRPARACKGVRECTRPLDEYSFPSGHTLHAVAFSIILGAYFPAFVPLLWGFTALVALSRVVLGLHFPSDVFVAVLIGGATAAASFSLF